MLVTHLAIAGAGDDRSYKRWVWSDGAGRPIAAILQDYASDPGCTLVPEDVDASRALFLLADADGYGFVEWRRGERAPRVFRAASNTRWALGPDLVFGMTAPERDAIVVERDAQVIFSRRTDPDGLGIAGTQPSVVGDGLVFEVGTLNHRALMRWHPERGTEVFRRFPPEVASAGNFGTDGAVMVWSEGRPRSSGRFDNVVVTATVEEPDRIREVVADPNPTIGTERFTVGCGRAARFAAKGPFVVALDSRRTQRLKADVALGEVLHLDCAQATVVGFEDGRAVLLRLPLDGAPRSAGAR